MPQLDPRETTIAANEEVVQTILLSLNTNMANGYDNINTKLLKTTAQTIAKFLSKGSYLNIWKKANIPPVLRHNERQNKNTDQYLFYVT